MKPVYASSIFTLFSLAISAVPCLSADFLYIVLQWPGSSCVATSGCCYAPGIRPPKDFAIAGLWPAFNNGTDPPEFCNHNIAFNITGSSSLTKSLDKYWPSLTCPKIDGRRVWAAQWRQYGTCSGLSLNQYFSRAMRYKKRASILNALANAGIQPNGKLYSTGDISDAIRVKVGQMPGLWCNKDKSGKPQLYQIVLCGIGNRIVDCIGIPQKNHCRGLVKFPSLKSYI